MAGQQEARDEGPEVRLDPNGVEGVGSDPQREREAEQHHDLAVSAPIEYPRGDGEQDQESGNECDRPPRRQRFAAGDEETYGCDVLQHEDRDGDASRQGTRLVVLLEGLDGEDRAREREGEADRECGPEVEVGGQRQSPCACPEQEDCGDDGTRGGEDDGGAPYITSGKGPYPELEPDTEQQQQNANIGYLFESSGRLLAGSVQRKAGGQVPDQGREADQCGDEAEGERRGQEGDFHVDALSATGAKSRTVSASSVPPTFPCCDNGRSPCPISHDLVLFPRPTAPSAAHVVDARHRSGADRHRLRGRAGAG